MTAQAGEAAASDRLENFPVTFFAVTMGLGGLALALRTAKANAGWPHAASFGVLVPRSVAVAPAADARHPDCAAGVVTQAPKLLRLPFALLWWALSFPAAALALASFRYGELTGGAFYVWLGFGLRASGCWLLAAIIVALLWRTGRAIAAGKVCVPEP